ncbi:MAG: deoxyhypusine synthase [Marinifilaceae bacterium]
MKKRELLQEKIEHIDCKSFDSTPIVNGMRKMSFSSRQLAVASDLFVKMLRDQKCSIILCLSGSTMAAGCKQLYVDMIRYNMVDAIVATGASIVDMDFFEAIGNSHYKGRSEISDLRLRENYINRIYDTYIDEDDLQACDQTIKEIADNLPPGIYSSREFILEMGRYLATYYPQEESLVGAAYENDVPIICPAFADSRAGIGLVRHQWENPSAHLSIDCVKDFRELTQIKITAGSTGLFIVGGGAPKNFAMDAITCAEVLGEQAPKHKYAVQITVADARDGACSSSPLTEAISWGCIEPRNEQMVFAEATTVVPLIISYAYHSGVWKKRGRKGFQNLFQNNS